MFQLLQFVIQVNQGREHTVNTKQKLNSQPCNLHLQLTSCYDTYLPITIDNTNAKLQGMMKKKYKTNNYDETMGSKT